MRAIAVSSPGLASSAVVIACDAAKPVLAPSRLLEELRIVDRDGRRRGERQHRRLVDR